MFVQIGAGPGDHVGLRDPAPGGITAFTIWRTQNDNRQLHGLERVPMQLRLEHGRAQLLLRQASFSLAFRRMPVCRQFAQAQAARSRTSPSPGRGHNRETKRSWRYWMT
jgi:hypothetical protein